MFGIGENFVCHALFGPILEAMQELPVWHMCACRLDTAASQEHAQVIHVQLQAIPAHDLHEGSVL